MIILSKGKYTILIQRDHDETVEKIQCMQNEGANLKCTNN